MKHKERRQREKEEMRQKLVEAAWDIVVKEGIDALTIRSLSEHVSYSTSIVYEYFNNKDDIFLEMNNYFADQVLNVLTQVPKVEDPDHFLIHLIQHELNFFIRHPRLVELISMETFGRSLGQQAQPFADIRNIFIEALKTCKCKKLHTQSELDEAVIILRSFRIGLIILTHHASSRAELVKKVDEIAKHGVSVLLSGWRH